MNDKQCFDITEELGEKPIAFWLGYRRGQLVLCCGCKIDSIKRWIVSMWEVHNGLHQRKSLCSVTIAQQADEKLALNKLLPLFGDSGQDTADITLKMFKFSSADEFWRFVSEHGLNKAVGRSRIGAN